MHNLSHSIRYFISCLIASFSNGLSGDQFSNLAAWSPPCGPVAAARSVLPMTFLCLGRNDHCELWKRFSDILIYFSIICQRISILFDLSLSLFFSKTLYVWVLADRLRNATRQEVCATSSCSRLAMPLISFCSVLRFWFQWRPTPNEESPHMRLSIVYLDVSIHWAHEVGKTPRRYLACKHIVNLPCK